MSFKLLQDVGDYKGGCIYIMSGVAPFSTQRVIKFGKTYALDPFRRKYGHQRMLDNVNIEYYERLPNKHNVDFYERDLSWHARGKSSQRAADVIEEETGISIYNTVYKGDEWAYFTLGWARLINACIFGEFSCDELPLVSFLNRYREVVIDERAWR